MQEPQGQNQQNNQQGQNPGSTPPPASPAGVPQNQKNYHPPQPQQSGPAMPSPPQGAQPKPGFPPPPPGGSRRSFMPPRPKPKVDDTPYTFGEIWKGYEFKITLPDHKTKFDVSSFIQLLAGSISLTKDEKRKIVESVPRLTQNQIDELMNILTDEKNKFIELSEKHKAQLRKLEKQHYEEWQDLEMKYEQEKRKAKDDEAADEIRKKLGL